MNWLRKLFDWLFGPSVDSSWEFEIHDAEEKGTDDAKRREIQSTTERQQDYDNEFWRRLQ